MSRDLMGIYGIKPRFQRVLQPLVDALVRRRVSPDWLTGGAVVVAALMGAALLWAAQWRGALWLVAAGGCLRLTLNALDGQVARALGHAGPWGEVKNELGDRLADALIFGALLLAPYVALPWSAAALLAAFFSGYVGILGKATTGTREYGGIGGKPDRMMALVLTCLLVAATGWWGTFTLFCGAVALASGLTTLQRLRQIRSRIDTP